MNLKSFFFISTKSNFISWVIFIINGILFKFRLINLISSRVLIPVINKRRMTPHAEASQALLWHLLVSSPLLADNETKWESIIKQNGGKN